MHVSSVRNTKRFRSCGSAAAIYCSCDSATAISRMAKNSLNKMRNHVVRILSFDVVHVCRSCAKILFRNIRLKSTNEWSPSASKSRPKPTYCRDHRCREGREDHSRARIFFGFSHCQKLSGIPLRHLRNKKHCASKLHVRRLLQSPRAHTRQQKIRCFSVPRSPQLRRELLQAAVL